MTVIRRLYCWLESTKEAVFEENDFYENMNITDKSGLTDITKYPFYNTSPYTLKKLLDEPNLIKENLIDYLNGFSNNVLEIISKFKFRIGMGRLWSTIPPQEEQLNIIKIKFIEKKSEKIE